jgi:hypothetical protein
LNNRWRPLKLCVTGVQVFVCIEGIGHFLVPVLRPSLRLVIRIACGAAVRPVPSNAYTPIIITTNSSYKLAASPSYRKLDFMPSF